MTKKISPEKELMPMLASESEKKKSQKLRNAEYYDMQDTLDSLYANSVKGKTFDHLMEIIRSPENIRMAYRNIKGNEGSYTPGIDKRTIEDLARMDEQDFIVMIQNRLNHYRPMPVRRVEIPKPGGKKRPLGIPTIVDRIIQQCIKQVLEPICEARFSESSYGFRPNRSAEHALAACMRLVNLSKLQYVVDVDIKGFFDNVNHNKLIRQIWAMGIRDKTLICIIKAMLRAPIVLPNGEIIIPDKGTPQGGILSPLLANIVLNELDQWINSQWIDFPTKRKYATGVNRNGSLNQGSKFQSLKNLTNLKEMYIVRYADDFKIFCRTKPEAIRTLHAVQKWLQDRLKLEVSPEKTKVINLKKHYSEFLGFEFKLWKKGNGFVVRSRMSRKAIKKETEDLKKSIKRMQCPKDDRDLYLRVNVYNAKVIGIHQYYKIATDIALDCGDIQYSISKGMETRLKGLGFSKTGKISSTFIAKNYGNSKQMRYVKGFPIIPVGNVSHKNPMCKKRATNSYTKEGREMIHKSLGISPYILRQLMEYPVKGESVEFNDNRISLYVAQNGTCAITKQLLTPDNMHCHHKTPKNQGGTDKYSNLILTLKSVHRLIHATKTDTIKRYLDELKLNDKQIAKVNQLRVKAGCNPI